MLKLRQVFLRNADVAQGSESRGYTIYGTSYLRHFAVKILAASDDCRLGVAAERKMDSGSKNVLDLIYGEGFV